MARRFRVLMSSAIAGSGGGIDFKVRSIELMSNIHPMSQHVDTFRFHCFALLEPGERPFPPTPVRGANALNLPAGNRQVERGPNIVGVFTGIPSVDNGLSVEYFIHSR
jgi:hypothetical protein